MAYKYGTRSKTNNHIELSDDDDYKSDSISLSDEESIDSHGNIQNLFNYSDDEETKLNVQQLVRDVLLGNIHDNISDYNSDTDSDFDDDMDVDDIEKKKKFKKKYTKEEYNYYKSLSKDEKTNIEYEEENLKDDNLNIPIRFKILDLPINTNDKTRILKQYEYYQNLNDDDADFSKLFRWFDEFQNLPLGKYSNIDTIENIKEHLLNTYKSLNTCIYGHDDAKIHILQYITKMISNPNGKANILALEGPMGNGKTTLIKDGVSKALNRPFAFISLGGQSDASYLVGESMSIIGSKQGILTEILCRLGTMNPIIYFDELDKVSESEKGKELINVLIHITDKSQNNIFRDRYFNLFDIDLSKIMFIFSFNDINKIDPILKDRLFIVKTSGFKSNDKITIAKDYLLKNICDDIGINPNIININEDIIRYIIDSFTDNEQGVRTLKKCLEDIYSKLNLLYLISDKDNINNNSKNISLIGDISKNNDINEISSFFKKNKNITFPYTINKEFCDLILQKQNNINMMMYT